MKMISVRSLLFLFSVALACGTASGHDYGGRVAARQIAKTTVTANGQPIEYLSTDKPEVTALVVDIPAGGQTGWHLHRVPVYAYVISGTLEVRMKNGRVRTYHSGDAIIETVDTAHNGQNRGKAPVKLVVFYTGGVGIPNTVKVPEK